MTQIVTVIYNSGKVVIEKKAGNYSGNSSRGQAETWHTNSFLIRKEIVSVAHAMKRNQVNVVMPLTADEVF